MKWSEAGSTLENMFIIRVDRCNPVTDIDGNKHDGGVGVETTRTRSVKGADGTKLFYPEWDSGGVVVEKLVLEQKSALCHQH